MKLIKQHKVILAVIMTSFLGSSCALLGPLMGMLTGGGLSLDEGSESLYAAGPDAAAQKIGYQFATSGQTEATNGANLYGAYRSDGSQR